MDSHTDVRHTGGHTATRPHSVSHAWADRIQLEIGDRTEIGDGTSKGGRVFGPHM
jgi:hypothetical protein